MAKALDSTALYAYFRRLGFSRETQEVLIHIRSSPPSRTPGARRGNMPVMHTADYFVFRYQSCGWIECKPAQELSRLVEKQPNRYVQDSQGLWRCPPGEAFAAKYGLTYQVWSSDTINWSTQENALFLEDYYQ